MTAPSDIAITQDNSAVSGSVVRIVIPPSCRECGKVFDPIPESYPLIIQEAFAEVDICSDCCARKIMECPYCGAERTYYDGWNCPTEGCDSQHNP